MNLGIVVAVFATLLATGIAFPGLLLAWWLWVPRSVERAGLRLGQTPWRCFWFGLAIVLAAVVVLGGFFSAAAGVVQLTAYVLLFGLLTLASLGAAGLAALMGERLRGQFVVAPAACLLRGAIALELAVAVPIVGWFVVLPVVLICSIGAASLALLRRRQRASRRVETVHGAHAT